MLSKWSPRIGGLPLVFQEAKPNKNTPHGTQVDLTLSEGPLGALLGGPCVQLRDQGLDWSPVGLAGDALLTPVFV